MEVSIVGFIAASTSIVAFSSQFIHTVQSKTTAGISINRSALDVISLVLWIVYATRLEDIPLLIATSCELATSIGVLFLIAHTRRNNFSRVKAFTPPQTETSHATVQCQLSRSLEIEDSITIDIKPERRYSV